jgi:hypothetical protein
MSEAESSKPIQAKENKPEEDYAPWDNSYSLAVVLAACSVIFLLASILLSRIIGTGSMFAVVISASVIGISAMSFSKGLSREFGKSFELKWVRRAEKSFEGSGLRVGRSTMTKVGDIDLLVECPGDIIMNVEIKSWRSYGVDQKFARRERQGLSQIHAQRGALEADASVLWLPQATENIMKSMFTSLNRIDDDTYLCCGNARKLKGIILKASTKI